jgi:hypothetical protein
MVTLALTGIVLETVAPEAGAVIATTRLPSWASTGDDIESTLRIANMAAALTRLTRYAQAL